MSKKLLVNKPSNIIEDYNKWFQIYELSGAFNTIEDGRIDEEGRIYIDEIWGNTWQDSDSKNLFDINSLQMVGNNAEKGIIDVENNSITFNYENIRDYGCETNFIFESSKKYKISADVEYNNSNINTRLMCIGPVGLGFEYLNNLLDLISYKTNYSERRFAVSVVIPNDGKQYALYLNGNSHQDNVTGNTIFKNIVIEEVDNTTDTTKPTEYIPYHKPDLSNIQHVGELISVDGDGQEKYKVEIEVCNKNLINQPLVQGRWEVTKGVFEPGVIGNVCCKELIKIQPNTTYQFSSSEGYRKALFFR